MWKSNSQEHGGICGICGKPLGVFDVPLSQDCGGDCWECIGEIEADGGYAPSLKIVREEFRNGLRNSWYPEPRVIFDRVMKNDIPILFVFCEFLLPLGEPRKNQSVEYRLLTDSKVNKKTEEVPYKLIKTNAYGHIKLEFEIETNDRYYFEIRASKKKWKYSESTQS